MRFMDDRTRAARADPESEPCAGVFTMAVTSEQTNRSTTSALPTTCEVEREMLVALLDASPAEGAELLQAARPEVLIDIARLSKLLFILWQRRDAIARHAPDILPRLDSYRLRTIAMNRRGMLLSSRITRALDRAGIPHVHLKGPLQQLVLFDDPFLKPSGDVDVLVAERHRAIAGRVLAELGYVPSEPQMEPWWVCHLGESHLRSAAGGPVIDLHHHLRQPGAPGLPDAAPLVADATRLAFDGGEAPVLSAPHRCLLAAIGVSKALLAREPCGGHLVEMRAALAALTPDETRVLGREARDRGLAETLAAARHTVARVLPRAGAPKIEAPDPLASVDDELLRTVVLTPWAAPEGALRRRRLLWALCGHNPIRFAAEARRKLASDADRRRLERRASHRSSEPVTGHA